MLEQKPPDTSPDAFLRHLREYVAAGIAIIIVLGTVVLMIRAISATSDEEQFARVKDLLLIVNPLLGVVLGYYFNKASTEARAENAESTAQNAVVNAQEAAKARDAAQAESEVTKTKVKQVEADLETTQQKAQEFKSVVQDYNGAVEKMAEHRPMPEAGILSAEDDPAEEAYRELQAIWARAKRLTD